MTAQARESERALAAIDAFLRAVEMRRRSRLRAATIQDMLRHTAAPGVENDEDGGVDGEADEGGVEEREIEQ